MRKKFKYATPAFEFRIPENEFEQLLIKACKTNGIGSDGKPNVEFINNPKPTGNLRPDLYRVYASSLNSIEALEHEAIADFKTKAQADSFVAWCTVMFKDRMDAARVARILVYGENPKHIFQATTVADLSDPDGKIDFDVPF